MDSRTKVDKASPAENPGAVTTFRFSHEQIDLSLVDPNPNNRSIDESDERFVGLMDSIRVRGVLDPLTVRRESSGRFRLADGERRWRAARKVGVLSAYAKVYEAGTPDWAIDSEAMSRTNTRQEPGSLDTARQLQAIKNTRGFTNEQLAQSVSMPLERVEQYSSLMSQASELLLEFMKEHHEVPVRVALAIARFERATNTVQARRLIARYKETPMTREQIDELRRRVVDAVKNGDAGVDLAASPTNKPSALARAFGVQQRKDPRVLVAELERLLPELGYRLMPLEPSVGTAKPA